jgi:hypothetical protein
MTIRIADPLPECLLCEVPTARATHEANGGLCSSCSDGIDATVRMLPVRLAPPADDRTAYVERYRPPVPPAKP